MNKTDKNPKTKEVITENTLMGEIVEKYPELVDTLTLEYGFHCFGCMVSEYETLGQGAAVHGMTTAETKKLVKTLNSLIASVG